MRLTGLKRSTLTVTVLLGALLALRPVDAGTEPKARRIGFVGFQSPGLEWSILAAFQTRLRELGWVEDHNLLTSYRWADGVLVNYPRIVQELVNSGVELMVIPCGPPLQALRKLKPTLPVVARCLDFRDFGREIETPTRPGGETTGVTYFSPGLTATRLALLKEIIPRLARVGLLYRPESDWTAHLADVETAARNLGLQTYHAQWRSAGELRDVLSRAIDQRVGAVLTLGDGPAHFYRHHLFEVAAELRLPVLYDFPMFPAADDVGLMAYYADVGTVFRTAAEQVDQILRGRRPGDIPLAMPRKFRFMINVRAARALGLTIPESLRQRADNLID